MPAAPTGSASAAPPAAALTLEAALIERELRAEEYEPGLPLLGGESPATTAFFFVGPALLAIGALSMAAFPRA